jgi:ubiquinone/menaquinone biosynthesis C-methylase UbiE
VWWNKAKSTSSHLYDLYGRINASSRLRAREYIKKMNYASILDIPCGFCTEYSGLINDQIVIDYYGIDIAESLVENAQKQGIKVIRASIEAIPYAELSFDLCYARHIFEHLSYYQKALSELIRVAIKEVIIIFSLKPHNNPDVIYLPYRTFYYNQYNKQKLERYIFEHKKVRKILWEDVNEYEIILHIYLYE